MVAATSALGASYSRGDVIPEVKLKDGTVLHDVKVVGVGSTSLMARWSGGQGSIAFAQLPPEIQVALVPPAAPKPVAAPTSAPVDAAKLASGELPTEIKLTNGFVMHHSVVTHWDEDAVLVSYQGGIVSVWLKNIVPGQRAIFEARKSDALAAQDKLAAEQALQTQAANQAAANAEQAWKLKSIEHSMSENARFFPPPPPEPPGIPEVRLRDGTVLHDFRVRAVADTFVVARWAGGQGNILLTQLSHELRDELLAKAPPKPVAPAGPAPKPNATALALLTDLKLPKDIKLTNGFVMHRSVVTHWDETAVLVSYPGGIVTVQFKNIVPEQRVIFEARKSEALAAQAKLAAEQAAAKRAMPSIEDAWQAKVATWKDEDARLDEAINQGLAGGYLVKGMTKDQVKQVMGRPQWGDEKDGSNFIYENGPSRDQNGNLRPHNLLFNQMMVLVAWFDRREDDMPGGENGPAPSVPERREAPPAEPARQPIAAPEPTPAAPVASRGSPPDSQLPTDIKLTNGFVMRGSVVTSWGEDAVLVSYSGGIVPVQFRNIAPEQRVIFEAHKTAALEVQARQGLEQAVANHAASTAEETQQVKDAQWKQEDDVKAQAISSGLAEHYLVEGMTKTQVQEILGPPQLGREANSDTFVYFGRGRDKYGVPANRYLLFNSQNILTGWWDQNGNEIDRAVQRTGTH